MNWKKTTLLTIALILITPLLISCTKEMGDQAADAFIDKLMGSSPTPTVSDRYDMNLIINLTVYKSLLGPNDPTEGLVNAYPQSITFHIYRKSKDTIFDVQDIEKWTDKQGKISFSLLFTRVYTDDVVSISYKPKLVEYDFGILREKSERLVTITDIASRSRYDENNKRYNLSVSDEGWLSPVLPATSSTSTRSSTPTPTKSR